MWRPKITSKALSGKFFIMKICLFKKIIIIIFCVLCNFNSAFPIIVNAHFLEKILDDGSTQRVYLFGDRKIWLSKEPEDQRKEIQNYDNWVQEQIFIWAEHLRACVMVEDLLERNIDDGELYKLFTVIPQTILKCFSYLDTASSPLKNLIPKCRANNIKVTNIEKGQNRRAGSYFSLPLTAIYLLSWILPEKSNLKKSARILSFVLCNCVLADLWQKLSIRKKMFHSPEKERIIEHFMIIDKRYKNDSSWYEYLLHSDPNDVFSDANTLSLILENKQQENFIICAASKHCYNISEALVAEGFTHKKFVADPHHSWSLGMVISKDYRIDIDLFFRLSIDESKFNCVKRGPVKFDFCR